MRPAVAADAFRSAASRASTSSICASLSSTLLTLNCCWPNCGESRALAAYLRQLSRRSIAPAVVISLVRFTTWVNAAPSRSCDGCVVTQAIGCRAPILTIWRPSIQCGETWGLHGYRSVSLSVFWPVLVVAPRATRRGCSLSTFSGLPVLREVLTWHVQYLLEKRAEGTDPSHGTHRFWYNMTKPGRALTAEHGELSHDLYRGMPPWFNAYYAYFQRRGLLSSWPMRAIGRNKPRWMWAAAPADGRNCFWRTERDR